MRFFSTDLLVAVAFLLGAWIAQAQGYLISPDGKTFPPPVPLVDVEYKVSSLRTEKRHQRQLEAIHAAIKELLKSHREFIYLCSHGGSCGGPFPLISTGFDYETSVSVHPKNEEEHALILAQKPELREKLVEELNDLFQNKLLKENKKLRLVLAPTKARGFSYEIQLTPTEDEETIVGEEEHTLESAGKCIGRAVNSVLLKQKPHRGSGMSSMPGLKKDTRHIFRTYQGHSDEENNRVQALMKEAIASVDSENSWFSVTFRPDLDE